MLYVEQTVGNKGRSEEICKEDLAIMQGRDNTGLNQESSDEVGEK